MIYLILYCFLCFLVIFFLKSYLLFSCFSLDWTVLTSTCHLPESTNMTLMSHKWSETDLFLFLDDCSPLKTFFLGESELLLPFV